jgi:DNA invertase Pin-like site-specific DNA recombinase
MSKPSAHARTHSTSTSTKPTLDLSGPGAAYIRVSDDLQDMLRQYAAIHAFEERHGVTIDKAFYFEDEGWARDTADRRPSFQRLMKMVESGRVRWIVVDQLDRFGMKSTKQLFAYLYRLEEAGCKLYDVSGKEWTGEDDSTELNAWVEGKKSTKEPRALSYRVLSGKAPYAKRGEWQGGTVPLGFDVGCYSCVPIEAGAGKLNSQLTVLWRVVSEGLHRRVKVYPDGRTERFDGENHFPAFQRGTEVLRLTPSNDKAKVAAAVDTFTRYATEETSFSALAHSLNSLGFRTSYGGYFQSHHVERMLADPIYLGYYAWSRSHSGKFHRWVEGQPAPELNYAEKKTHNDSKHWVQSHRLFEPLVVQDTWAKVQRKLENREKRTHAPRNPALYLSGLVCCSHCGKQMHAQVLPKPMKYPRKDGSTGEKYEYFCSTYFKAVREGRWRKGKGYAAGECKCLRNPVTQDVLEGYVQRWLEETGTRLELLTSGLESSHLTDKLTEDVDAHWQAFFAGVERLTTYLSQHHPDDYNDIAAGFVSDAETDPADPTCDRTLAELLGERGRKAWDKYKGCDIGPGGFVEACLDSYRTNFDPAALDGEIERLEAEHSTMMEKWADLPAHLTRARQKAEERMASLESRIEALRQQQQDAAEVVGKHWREILDLQKAVREARASLHTEAGERALKRKAAALRAVIHRIDCTFRPTAQAGQGWGKRATDLVRVTVCPVVGDAAVYEAEGSLRPSRDSSGVYRPLRAARTKPRY